MPYDAFISYCSEDKKVADAVCGTLEANKIRCWIAPRDVTAEIVPGIGLEKMGFAVRKSDRTLLQELDTQLKATAATRDGVLSKSIPGWSN